MRPIFFGSPYRIMLSRLNLRFNDSGKKYSLRRVKLVRDKLRLYPLLHFLIVIIVMIFLLQNMIFTDDHFDHAIRSYIIHIYFFSVILFLQFFLKHFIIILQDECRTSCKASPSKYHFPLRRCIFTS